MTAAPAVERPEHVIRPALVRTDPDGNPTSDEKLIYSAWIKGAWEVEPTNRIPRELYIPLQEQHIRRRLRHSRSLVLCHPGAARELIGFCVFDAHPWATVVHWLYVWGMFRRMGFASVMLDAASPGWRSKPLVTTGTSKHTTRLAKSGRLIVFPQVLG